MDDAPESSDIKIPIPVIEMNREDESAIDLMNVAADDDLIESTSIENLDDVELESNETAKASGGKILITKRIDENLEMIYTYKETCAQYARTIWLK